MGGEAPHRPPLSEEGDEALRLARRVELAKLAVGVPALLISLFASVLAFRLAKRSLGDPLLWFTALGVIVVFGAYFGHSVFRLRKLRPRREEPETDDTLA